MKPADVGAIAGDVGFAGAFIARDRRRAIRESRQLPDRVEGTALFADISGFTTVTEMLAAELGPQRGAEELTAVLDRIFQALIGELQARGGVVIYFSGDAITCWIDGDDGISGASCAIAMQEAMQRHGEFVSPAGTVFRLALKVAIVVGKARRFVAGDPEIQLIDVLAGSLIDELAAAEHHASPGEVVLGPSALDALGDRVDIAERRLDPDGDGAVGVLAGLNGPAAEARVLEPEQPLPEELVRPWVLPAIYERLRAGRGDLLAELRPAIPVFVRFGGIEYDTDAAAAEKLDDFIRRAQRAFADCGGNILQLTIGDKGAYLYAVFGSPQAHEDDASRALTAALRVRALEHATSVSGIQIGITTGRLLSGSYGHAVRRTFSCLGDAVNLSARLMSNAPPGEIYVSEVVRQRAGNAFQWERLEDLRVKGKAKPVKASALRGAATRGSRRQQRYYLELFGRRAEMEALAAALDASREGRGSILGIAAEAGMGKSRLVAEFIRTVRARGGLVAYGECPTFGDSSYAVWCEVWRTLLGIGDSEPEDVQLAMLQARLADVDDALPARAPLLEPLLNMTIPDTDLTSTLDPKLRKASLEDLLTRCLQARAAAHPLVVVLEDCHWIDQLSRDLLEVLVRAAASLPVLFVVTYRPAAEPGGGLGLVRLPQFAELLLDELAPEDAELLIQSKLAQLFGEGTTAPAALVELVTTRAQGNPFYVEELLNYMRATGVDMQDESKLRRLEAPESLHSLILSRIDTLEESQRRTLKVASVLGRSFRAAVLPGVYPELGSLDDVRDDLRVLRAADLVSLDREAEEAYIFKHVVTEEVTYESLPFATRAMLHDRTGGYIEATEADTIDQQLDLLAYHYWRGQNTDKKRHYLLRAGKAAQESYANAAAIDYFEKVVPLLAEPERIDALLSLGKVIELTGDVRRAEGVEREALQVAEQIGDAHARARCEAALAEEARRQGRFDEAAWLLASAADAFGAADDEAGVGRVQHLAGTLAAQQGAYDDAIARYEGSLAIRERLDDKASIGSLLSNLGIVAEYRGDLELALEYHGRALALRQELGDRWAIGVSLNNLGTISVQQGDYASARPRFEEAMRLGREVGDAWMVAVIDNSLGNAARGLGDHEAARRHYAASLRAYRDYDDAWSVAILLEDIAELAAMIGQPARAYELAGAADALRDEIGAPRAPASEQHLEETTAAHAGSLDPDERSACRERGRRLDADGAFRLALAVCEPGPDNR